MHRSIARWTRGAVAALAVVSWWGCGGGDKTVTPPTPPTVTLSASPTSLTVTAGQGGTATVNVGGANLTGPISLSVTGAPSGVTATLSPTSVSGTAGTSTLTIATTAATAPGTYTLTLTGSTPGSSGSTVTQTASFALVVNAAPSIGVSLSPTTLSVQQGQSGTATLNITRTNFTGSVTVAASGAPTGLTVTPSGGGTGNTATLAVAVASTVAPGTYPVTITTSGTGITSQTTTLTVTVTAAPPPGSITLSASPNPVSVQQGSTATATLGIARTNFTEAVSVAVSGAPAGLTVTPAATSVTGASTTLAIAAAANTAPGSYPITITGSGTGITNATTTLNVTVTAAPAASFALSLNPATLSLQQGATGTSTLNINRTNFTGAVGVAVAGAPAGLTVTPASASTTGNSMTISVAAASNVPAGVYPITVTGSATGLTNQTATLTVTITQSGGGSGNITIPLCAEDSVIWVGFQNEGGAWTRATMTATSATVNVPTRGVIGVVTRKSTGNATGPQYTTQLIYGSAAELSALSAGGCALVGSGNKAVKGTVAGLTQFDLALVTLGGSSAQVSAAVPGFPNFTLQNVEDGPQDLLATRAAIDLTTGGLTPNKLILRRDLNVANNGSLALLDFNATEAVAPASANVTIQNMGSDQPSVFTSYISRPGAPSLAPFAFSGGSGTSTQKYYGVPASLQLAGDLHLLFVLATPPGANSSDGRGVIKAFKLVADQTVVLGAPVAAPSVTLAGTTPYARFRVQQPVQSDYASGLNVTLSQQGSSTASFREFDVLVLPGYTATTPTTWDVTIPDMTAGGYDPTWGLRPATATNWDVNVLGGNIVSVFTGAITEGMTVMLGTRSGQTTSLRALRAPLSGGSSGSLSTSAPRNTLTTVRELRRRLPQ